MSTRAIVGSVAAILLVTGTAASASQLTLVYSGSDIPLVDPPADFIGDVYPAFSGSIILDESVFGGSVANKTLTFFGISSPADPFDMTDGIISWSHGVPLYSVGGTAVSITFDGVKQVVNWTFDALDGPPDYYSTSAIDAVFGGLGGRYSVQAGTWTSIEASTVIPLPASGLLLGAAALAMAAVRRRHPESRSSVGQA